MPPPELLERPAPASVGELLLSAARASAPLLRHRGERAEEAYLRGRATERLESGDAEGEREASIALARLLASRGQDLGGATRYAMRALSLGDDPALRTELAGWLAGLGEAGLAAATLRGLCDPNKPKEAARTLVKIAVLLARSDSPAAAADALVEAANLDPNESMPCELLGTLAAWATGVVDARSGADAYLEAAARRESAGDAEGAFEDRLRAFELAPEHASAADPIARELTAQGRAGAADEVLRAHASAQTDREMAIDVHRNRLAIALKDGDGARAIGALFDGGLEAASEDPDASRVDEALALAGLYEVLAARVEARAEASEGSARAEAYDKLARLYAGPLSSPDRALEAWIEAAVADPSTQTARAALRDHAQAMHDPSPLVEALVRIGELEENASLASHCAAAMRELALLAEDRLGDAGLAMWALGRLAAFGDRDFVTAELSRLKARASQQDESMALATKALDGGGPEARFDALRKLATIQRGRPDARDAYVETLTGLVRAAPAERVFWTTLERLCGRASATGAARGRLAELLRERIASSPPRVDLVRAALSLASTLRKRGDEVGALDLLEPLLDEVAGHRGLAAAALLLSSRLDRPTARASAIEQLAGPAAPPLRSTLLAIAAELSDKRRLAEQACEADPSNARAVAVLAELAGGSGDRLGAAAVERAMGVVLPRGVLCDTLARSLEAIGEAPIALAWTQRWLALRPGSPEAISHLVRRATLTRDAARIADSLGWVLAQPKPLIDLSPQIIEAIEALFALDRSRARALAKRSLDVLGPRAEELREALLSLASKTNDRALAISVLERYLAVQEEDDELARGVLLELARRRIAAGDLDGAARELSRAAERDADAPALVELLDLLEETRIQSGALLSSDGRVAAAEARAHAVTKHGPEAAIDAALAWRDVAALRWDLAEDQEGAEDALYAASFIAPRDGVEIYARDLAELAGVPEAIEILRARAAGSLQPDAAPVASQRSPLAPAIDPRKVSANLLIEAANLAMMVERFEQAQALALAAIDADPSRADAIAIVERCVSGDEAAGVLDVAYRKLAAAALGVFGRRAAHYRASRQLERRGALDLALEHAALCFEAVPSEGTVYLSLARLAERASDPTPAIDALERTAAKADKGARAAWLLRAAAVAGKSEAAADQRLTLLLEALRARPDVPTVLEVGAASIAVAAIHGEPERVADRFRETVLESLRGLDGPDGARAAVAMAKVALGLRADSAVFSALTRAMKVDGDIDEYASLEAEIPKIASLEGAAAWLADVRATAAKPYSSIGAALLVLASKLAAALGDPIASATLLADAAKRSPDDDALVVAASQAVSMRGDEALQRALDGAVPSSRRAEALLAVALQREQAGDDEGAIVLVEEGLTSLAEAERGRVVGRLRELYGRTGRGADAELLLEREIARPTAPIETKFLLARELSSTLVTRRAFRRAFDVLIGAVDGPLEATTIDEARKISVREGDPEFYRSALERLAERAADPAQRSLVVRELASLAKELGAPKTSDRPATPAAATSEPPAVAAAPIEPIAPVTPVAQVEPPASPTTQEIEESAAERGDFVTVVEQLAKRIAEADPSKKRTLRLRRAAVLEQRLDRVDEAITELEALLVESPNDTSALRYLADVHERRGEADRAAPLLLTLRDAATDDERIDYGFRAAKSLLACGRVEPAAIIIDELGADPEAKERYELPLMRVDLARLRKDYIALGAGLELIASSSTPLDAERAELLVEAAEAAVNAGDEALALDRSRRAAKLAPMSAPAVLLSRKLEYKLAGTGTPRDAQAAAQDLQNITDAIPPDALDLHAFLLAEQLDVIQGGGAGMRELSRRHAEIGALPLVALGMAERLVRAKSFEAALPLFERALAGDLRGLRTRGKVALAAAEAAQLAAFYELADKMLALAESEPDTQKAAHRRKLELEVARADVITARSALEELSRITTGIDRARVLTQLARIVTGDDPVEAERLYAEAAPLASFDRALSTQIADARARLQNKAEEKTVEAPPGVVVSPLGAPPVPRTSPTPPPMPAPVEAQPTLVAPQTPTPPPLPATPLPPPLPVPVVLDGRKPAPARAPEPSVAESVTFEQRPHKTPEPEGDRPKVIITQAFAKSDPPVVEPAPVSIGGGGFPSPIPDPPPSIALSQAPVDEKALWSALIAGDSEAGDRLLARLGSSSDRSRDVLAIRRKQAALRLGDRGALMRLLDAAELDGNPAYARAIEHVLNALTGEEVPAPALSGQRDAPDLLRSLLFRSALDTQLHEVLSIIWETGMFRREPASVGLTGVERVQLGHATQLAETYASLARLLGLARTPLFHHRSAAAVTVDVVPLAQPGIVVTGDAREETPELRYALGAALAGAMPEHVLVRCLEPDRFHVLIEAIVVAFGPVRSSQASPDAARVAQDLWQLVPPRSERRLRDLCSGELIADILVAGTRTCARRAGLFASGSLRVAITATAAELGLDLAPYRAAPDGLARLSADAAEIGDLVRLAIRTELAEARWQPR